MASVTLYLRGRLVKVDGYVEGPDHSVGITGSAFLAEHITWLEDNYPRLVWVGPCEGDEDALEAHLTDSEWNDIDAAYWVSLPFEEEDHLVLDRALDWEPTYNGKYWE